MSMRVKEILSIGEKQLKDSGDADAAVDIKWLYCYMMHVDHSKLILEYQKVLPDRQCDSFFQLLDRRSSGEPLQYIIGSTEFMGLTFRTDPRALIPRQETELLAEYALSILKDNTVNGQELKIQPKKNPEILDLCCGTGAIGLSVAKLADSVKVTCSDLSEDAVALAKENAEALGVNNVTFKCGDLCDPLRGRLHRSKFDMILSNPPYIRTGVIPTLQREINEHEPMMALDGGDDGLAVYRRMIPQLPDFLKKEGIVMLEIGYDQMQAVKDMFAVNGRFINIMGLQDLAGRDRIVAATLLK